MEILILSNEEQDRNLFISCLSADKSSFTFCPSEAKRGEYSAALRRYQEAKPPLDTSRLAARRIHLIITLSNNRFLFLKIIVNSPIRITISFATILLGALIIKLFPEIITVILFLNNFFSFIKKLFKNSSMASFTELSFVILFLKKFFLLLVIIPIDLNICLELARLNRGARNPKSSLRFKPEGFDQFLR